MKILNTGQIRRADAYTIEHEPISSVALMERAGEKCFDWIYQNAPSLFAGVEEEKNFLFRIFCGIGNNGGDGLVIAGLLHRHGYSVEVYILGEAEKGSAEFVHEHQKLSKRKVKMFGIASKKDIPATGGSETVLIDALFGIGLNRPVIGLGAEVISFLNESPSKVISIDIPSGIDGDGRPPEKGEAVVKADYTLTFQLPKLPFFLRETAPYAGQVVVLDIGLHAGFLNEVSTDHHLFTLRDARGVRQSRGVFSHKGTFGHTLIIAGSKGKRGAATLAAAGALRAGAGLVTVHTDEEGGGIIHSTLPEAMVSIDPGKNGFTALPDLGAYDVIAVGPGLGTSEETARALKLLIQEAKVPLVMDADAVNILAENPTWMAFLPPTTILTPHPGEFARLIGEKPSHMESTRKQSELCKRFGIYVVLKGAHTSVGLPDGQLIFNDSGNPGMATGGMGDVLTGIIASLLGQGYGAMDACALGVFVHGLAGDLALERQSVESLLPSDVIAGMGAAFKALGEE